MLVQQWVKVLVLTLADGLVQMLVRQWAKESVETLVNV
jgi:hypothetical protein